MGAQRRSRTARPGEAPALEIQERDHWIFESLGKMDFLTTSQIRDLHFSGCSAATTKRMGKLHRAGYVRVWVRGGNLAAENVYSLDRRGAPLVAEVTGERPRVPQGLETQFEHRRLINEVRIRFALALVDDEGEIVFWRNDRELAGRFSEPIVPDALFAIGWPDRVQPFALEVEHRTKDAHRFLRKILRYQAFSAQGLYGASELITLVVAQEEKWLERYRRALQRTYLSLPIFFGLAEAIQASPLRPLWRSVGDDGIYSLRTLPCRKEGEPSVTPREQETSDSNPEAGTTV